MSQRTYIIDSRHRAGLNISTLTRRRPAAGNGRLAQALAVLVLVIVSSLAIYTTITANQ